MALRFCVAQQYFGHAAYVDPSADAWLSDSVSGYLAYLMLEDAEGHEAFLKAVNRDWVSALQLTVPGGLNVTSDAALFNGKHYDIVVRIRGAVVLHELREAMGPEALLGGPQGVLRTGAGRPYPHGGGFRELHGRPPAEDRGGISSPTGCSTWGTMWSRASTG